MPLRLLFFLCLTLTLQAAMPKTYASIGDPVYRAVGPVGTLSTYKSFRGNRDLFKAYVAAAEAAQKEGQWLDTHRKLPEAKKRSDSYLKTLRHLQKVNAQITDIVENKTLKAIEKRHKGTYFAIKKSGYPALIDDPEFRRATQRFERRLKAERAHQKKQTAREQAAFLRSYGNLKGDWRTTSASGKSIVYRFLDKQRLMIVKQDSAQTQTMEGTWRIDGEVMQIALATITNQKTGGIPHQRTTDVKLQMQVRAIGKEKMTLFDTRRKSLLTFFR